MMNAAAIRSELNSTPTGAMRFSPKMESRYMLRADASVVPESEFWKARVSLSRLMPARYTGTCFCLLEARPAPANNATNTTAAQMAASHRLSVEMSCPKVPNTETM